jgi:hypothetical protein
MADFTKTLIMKNFRDGHEDVGRMRRTIVALFLCAVAGLSVGCVSSRAGKQLEAAAVEKRIRAHEDSIDGLIKTFHLVAQSNDRLLRNEENAEEARQHAARARQKILPDKKYTKHLRRLDDLLKQRRKALEAEAKVLNALAFAYRGSPMSSEEEVIGKKVKP